MKRPQLNNQIEKSFPVSLGNIHKVKIIDKSERGDGIAKIKNFIIFVPNVDIGDIVKIQIVRILKNCAFANKAKSNDKTFLTKGPLVPSSFSVDVEEELVPINPWKNSKNYNRSSRHGKRCGKCKECGGSLLWDSKHSCNYCQECGLLG